MQMNATVIPVRPEAPISAPPKPPMTLTTKNEPSPNRNPRFMLNRPYRPSLCSANDQPNRFKITTGRRFRVIVCTSHFSRGENLEQAKQHKAHTTDLEPRTPAFVPMLPFCRHDWVAANRRVAKAVV